jgi:hypothetical protein
MRTLFILIALVLNLSAWAQTPSKTTLETVKEVFLKGSIDGDKMFMVLGTADGFSISKKMMKDAIDMDDLAEYAEEAQDIQKAVISFKNVIKKPWKSLKKIPQAYQVDFEKAQDAYYGADSQISGVLKYSGWAVWAHVEGAYYLVIEAPIVMAAHAIGSSVYTAWEITTFGLKVTWDVIKPAFALVASTAVMTYSAISSGIATTATLLAAGGVAAYKGGKWLIVEMPSKLFKPVSAVASTTYNYDEQKVLADKLLKFLTNHGDIFGDKILVDSEVSKYKSNFSISFEKDGMNAFELKTIIKNKKIDLKLEVKKAYFKKMRRENSELSRAEVKQKLIQEMNEILNQITQQA